MPGMPGGGGYPPRGSEHTGSPSPICEGPVRGRVASQTQAPAKCLGAVCEDWVRGHSGTRQGRRPGRRLRQPPKGAEPLRGRFSRDEPLVGHGTPGNAGTRGCCLVPGPGGKSAKGGASRRPGRARASGKSAGFHLAWVELKILADIGRDAE